MQREEQFNPNRVHEAWRAKRRRLRSADALQSDGNTTVMKSIEVCQIVWSKMAKSLTVCLPILFGGNVRRSFLT
jgi:hypothetical protein